MILPFRNSIKAQCLCAMTTSESSWDEFGSEINDDSVKKYYCGNQPDNTFFSSGGACKDFHMHFIKQKPNP